MNTKLDRKEEQSSRTFEKFCQATQMFILNTFRYFLNTLLSDA